MWQYFHIYPLLCAIVWQLAEVDALAPEDARADARRGVWASLANSKIMRATSPAEDTWKDVEKVWTAHLAVWPAAAAAAAAAGAAPCRIVGTMEEVHTWMAVKENSEYFFRTWGVGRGTAAHSAGATKTTRGRVAPGRPNGRDDAELGDGDASNYAGQSDGDPEDGTVGAAAGGEGGTLEGGDGGRRRVLPLRCLPRQRCHVTISLPLCRLECGGYQAQA